MMSLRGWKNDFEALRSNPEPIHRRLLTGKLDAGNPPVRFGREGERQRSSYPHQKAVMKALDALSQLQIASAGSRL